MSSRALPELQDVILDEDFPNVDMALRRGRHIDRDDVAWYALLTDGQELLEPFYRRYGCELVHKPDGYFYLLPTGDKLSRRQVSPGDMLVGQALTLLYLDPSSAARGGRVTMEELLAQLAAVLGADALVQNFNPTRKRHDERAAQRTARVRITESTRRLASLGFVDVEADGQLRLRASLLRFAEPVRGLSAPAEALASLVASGEVVFDDGSADVATAGDDDVSDDDAADDDAPNEPVDDAPPTDPDQQP